MAAPTFVNAGAMGGQAANTTVTLPLPGSRVNGNLLVAFLQFAISNRTPTWPAGWTSIANTNGASGSAACAYRYVDGTETACSPTWTGLANVDGRIYQYSGTLGSAPIGAHHETISSAGNTGSDAGATATSNNSLFILLLGGGNDTETRSSGPGGSWNTDSAWTTAGVGGVGAWSESTPSTVGSASDSSSFTMAGGAGGMLWSVFTIELLSEVAPTEAHITASPALGISQATTLTTSVSISASPSLGISEAVTFSDTQNLTASPALGLSEAAAVQLERDLVASAALGVSMAAQVRAAKIGAQPVVCITT
jgi:hypothetical protein